MLPSLRKLPKPLSRSFSQGTFPIFVDETQPPQRRQPFASLRQQQAVHSVELILPDTLVDAVKATLDSREKGRYAKVIMSLGEVLDGDFFTQYIKMGNVMMISEGRRGLDTRFELFDGILRIEVDKATYERAGLVGKAIPDGGVKHSKNRFAIEINLRQPSMLHGKRGFERILWACSNVFYQSLTWLFYDHSPQSVVAEAAPIDKHYPRRFTISPTYTHLSNIRVPTVTDSTAVVTTEYLSKDVDLASDLEEWISLVALQSPRVQAGDNPNAFICRYSFPSQDDIVGEEQLTTKVVNLTKITWSGFIPSSFVLHVLLAAKKASKIQGWWALRSKGLRRDNETVTVLQRSRYENGSAGYFCWHKSI